MQEPGGSRRWRRQLVRSTALTTTLAALLLAAPAPSQAQQSVNVVASPVAVSKGASVDCVFSGDCIFISTVNDGSSVTLLNSGFLTAGANGINTSTVGNDAPIEIRNSGGIDAGNIGIRAATSGEDSGITIVNSGDIAANNGILNNGFPASDTDNGMDVRVSGEGGKVRIRNSGDISSGYDGIYVLNTGGHNGVSLLNTGVIRTGDRSDAVSDGGEAIDVRTYTGVAPAPIPPEIPVPDALKLGPAFSPVAIINHGAIYSDDDGIEVCTSGLAGTNCRGGGGSSPVLVVNTATIIANYVSIDSVTYGPDSPIVYFNSGKVVSNEESIDAETSGDGSFIDITNSGDVTAGIDGISAATAAYAAGDHSPIRIFNTGDIVAGEVGIYAKTAQNFQGDFSPISIVNHGGIAAQLNGIYAVTNGTDSHITIVNSGDVSSKEESAIFALAGESGSRVSITTGGVLRGNASGIFASAGSSVRIETSADVSAESGLAIDTNSLFAGTGVFSSGIVTGRIDLSGGDDVFVNRSAGIFEARGNSLFRAGDDLFDNRGLLHTAADNDRHEHVSFLGLEAFENAGLVSLADHSAGDRLTLPGSFAGKSGSRLELDAALDGMDSHADLLEIGNGASGRTLVTVNNVGTTGGSPTANGIVIITVAGDVKAGAFRLADGPVDGGFFNYDLFFRPDGGGLLKKPAGGGVFELKSSIGPGAYLLPELLTAGQDIWHETAATWSERMASLDRTAVTGLWITASTASLSRDDEASTTAYDRSYTFDLGRDLDLQQVQLGFDAVEHGMAAPGDRLVLGVLAGGILGDLDYERIDRAFDIEGFQLGAYASYLAGPLRLDALASANIFDLDTTTPGLQQGLDGTSYGIRLEAGYRMGGTSLHLEPVATLSAAWTSIDDVTSGQNTVAFEDATSVRGRLGLKAGTAVSLFGTASLEPYLMASLWSELDGDNDATLTSLGQSFAFSDSQEDVWGEVSAGLDVRSASLETSAFAKLDVTFGEEIEGVAGRVGASVKW